MPSFFAKVFGRKKDEKGSPTAHTRRHSASASLLEGKYEAVSPTSSPTADKFTHEFGHQGKDREKDAGFSLFRPRSRSTASPQSDNAKSPTPKPHLELNLTVQKEVRPRALGVVFEAADDRGYLPEAVVGDRRLTPQETYQLIKACAAAIVDRGGLETLGVMHPHWYSASPDVQRRLISLFILSLTTPSSTPLTTLSPSPETPFALFDSELTYTRSLHDIAAVLRWALRHLRLESSSFGLSSDKEDPWNWYDSFLESERSANYPTHAFSQSLVPSIPPPHLQLLTATLDIISSLAAHAETNGSSGSKLTKFFGLWLLTAERTLETDDWTAFYARWERAGRILEHLFLSYVRDEAGKKNIPLRLAELVKHFPYISSAEQHEDGLLSRPRFSTRRYDALFVRISTELPTANTLKPKQHPLKFIARAFEAEVIAEGDYISLWSQLKQATTNEARETKEGSTYTHQTLSHIFNDDTLRLLSLIPLESKDSPKTITLATSARESRPVRRRSTSLGPVAKANGQTVAAVATMKGKTHSAVSPTPASIPLPASPTDWVNFSTSGFGDMSLGNDFASTLLDSDVEVTEPPRPRRKGSNKRKATSSPAASRRSSADNPRPLLQQRPTAAEASPMDIFKTAKTQASVINIVKLDEAFVDFWSDAITDPILTSNWPTFVLCQLKTNSSVASDGKPINWLVIEHAFTYPPPPAPVPEPTSPTSSKRPSSPRPSVISNLSSRKSSTFSSRPRFGFFGGNSEKGVISPSGTPKSSFSLMSPGGRKRAFKAPRVGEMGEVLAEIEESPKPTESENALGLGITTATSAKLKDSEPATLTATPIKAEKIPVVVPHTFLASVPEDEKKEAAPPLAPQSEPTDVTPKPEATKVGGSVQATVAKVPSAPVETDVTASAVTETELPPVPVVDAVPTSAPEPIAVEPLAPDEENPAVSSTQVDIQTDNSVNDNDSLPPAPEHVLSGGTSGTQVALNTNEPAALAMVAVPPEPVSPAEPQPEYQEEVVIPSAAQDENVSAPDSVNIASTTVKQEDAAFTPAALPSADVDQVITSTSTPGLEILVEAPTANEETVKGDGQPAASEPVEPQSTVIPVAPVDDAPPKQSVVKGAQANTGSSAGKTLDILAESNAGASAVPPTAIPSSELVVEPKPTLPENGHATVNMEALPRAVDSDPVPCLSAEANSEPAVSAVDEAEVSHIPGNSAPVEQNVNQIDATSGGAEAKAVENAEEENTSADVGASVPLEPVDSPPPTIGGLDDSAPVNIAEPAEETSAEAMSSDRRSNADTSTAGSIGAPEEVMSVTADAGSKPVVEQEETQTEGLPTAAVDRP